MGPMSLPPGFRFHPTDDELVGYYLKRKVDGRTIELEVIPVIELYKFDPWDLPDKSFLPKRDMEWFFFCPRDKKYPNGSRTNRATVSGYWKATGKDRKVYCESSVQGLRKTLVFYRGRAPGGERTDWIMHEYRLCEDLSHPIPNFLGAFALCRVVKRNELGLKNGDFQGESKGKRTFPSNVSDFGKRTNFNKGLSITEENPTKSRGLFEISNDSPLISSLDSGREIHMQPVMAETDQSGFWGSQHLYDAPKDYSMEQSFMSKPFPLTQFSNSTESCPSSSISPVSSYASFTDETYLVDDLDAHRSLVPFESPLPHMNEFCSEDSMEFLNFDWQMPRYMNAPTSDVENYHNVFSPLICRQASDIDEASLWLQEDSLLVVM